MRMRNALLLTLVSVSWAGAQTGGSRTIATHYGTQPAQRLLLLYPPGPGPFPVVVFVHGGGWTQGDPEVARGMLATLGPAGYAIASVEYRKPPKVDPAEAIEDVARAAAYVQKHGAELNLRSDAFALLGHSAGGQMETMVALDPQYAQRAGLDLTKLKVVGVLDGFYNLKNFIETRDTPQKKAHLKSIFGEDPAVWSALSPVNALQHATVRPLFCVEYEDGLPAFAPQAQEFIDCLKRFHWAYSEIVAHGYTHEAMLGEFKKPEGGPVSSGFLSCMRKADFTNARNE